MKIDKWWTDEHDDDEDKQLQQIQKHDSVTTSINTESANSYSDVLQKYAIPLLVYGRLNNSFRRR